MEIVVGLLVLLLRTCQAVARSCDGRQDGARCYGVLGGSVNLQLMDNTSEIPNYIWRKKGLVMSEFSQTIFVGQKNNLTSNTLSGRSLFFPDNGTFRIDNLSRTDGGEYELEIFNSTGAKTGNQTLQLYLQGMETYCEGRRDGSLCFGALGGTVVIQLVDIFEIYRFTWKKNGTTVFRKINNTINTFDDRFLFIPSNGTFIVHNLNRTDSAEYKLEIFNSDAINTGNRALQLFVEALVPSVQLVSQCLSQREMKVSCSSEGWDSPQYSWTLDGHTLTDSELLFVNNETNIIILRQNVSGRVSCSVRNHFSVVSKEQIILQCSGPRLLVCSLLFVVTFLSCGGIALYFKWKETKYKKEPSAPQRKEPLEDFTETELRSLSDD